MLEKVKRKRGEYTPRIIEVYLRLADPLKNRILLIGFGTSNEQKIKAKVFAKLVSWNDIYPIEVWEGDSLVVRYCRGNEMTDGKLLEWVKQYGNKTLY